MIFPKPYSVGRRVYPIMGYTINYMFTNPLIRDDITNGYAYILDGTQPFTTTISPTNTVSLFWQAWNFQGRLPNQVTGYAYVLFPNNSPNYPDYAWSSNQSDPTKNSRLVVEPPLPVSKSITTKQLSNNYATLTTSTAHTLLAGNYVQVSGVDATFDGGPYLIVSKTVNTFTYRKTSAVNVGPLVVSPAGTVQLLVPPTMSYWEINPDYTFEDISYRLYALKGIGGYTNTIAPLDLYFKLTDSPT